MTINPQFLHDSLCQQSPANNKKYCTLLTRTLVTISLVPEHFPISLNQELGFESLNLVLNLN
jgi:hypothetical protein